MSIKEPAAGRKPLAEEPPAPGANESKVEKTWRFLTITKKNRTAPAPAPIAAAKPRAPAKVALRRKRSASVSSEEAAPRTRRSPSVSSSSDLSDVEADVEALSKSKVKRIRESPESEDEAEAKAKAEQASTKLAVAATTPVPAPLAEEGEKEIGLDVVIAEVPVPKGKKRPAKPKAAKSAKKARIEEVLEDKIDVEPVLVVPPEPVAEIKLLDEIKPGDEEVGVKVKAKPAKPKKPAQTPLEKLVADGTIADEEDAYWLSQALRATEGAEPELDEDVEVVLDEEHPLYHTSGSWRAEGWKKIPQIQKSRYLPQRNRAAVAVEDAGALTTGRSARVTGRRLALDMETHRKTAAATSESDLFAFNQLRIRKKQLRFARSAIEGYGLYAMETIQTGEMVCEYVGELIRSSVADLREHRYLRQGIGSSYLFRIDGDVVCDATFRGSVRCVGEDASMGFTALMKTQSSHQSFVRPIGFRKDHLYQRAVQDRHLRQAYASPWPRGEPSRA
jgi:histone-lysine N-methyltransferase SETD1